MKLKKLSQRELQVLVNALIFTGCTDISMQTEEGFQKEYIDLAVKIKESTGTDPDDTIAIYGHCQEEPELAQIVMEKFCIKVEK